MALNIKNSRVEQLAAEVATLAGETKTQAIGRALEERKQRLMAAGATAGGAERLLRFLEREIWADLPAEQLDSPPLSKKEKERILGLGEEGF
jgi:antitoxin VapB